MRRRPSAADASERFGACRTRRWRDRRPHRARARPRGRPAQAGPDRGDHRPRHRARPGDPAGAGARLRARADPRRAAAAQAHPRAAHRARPAARRHQGGRRVLDRDQADCVVGFGGYVALPGYLAARRLGVPIVVHEANARPGPGQPDRRAAHRRTWSPAYPDSSCAAPATSGIPLRRVHRHPRPAAVRAEARACVRPGRRPAHAAGLRRLAGRPRAQRGGPAGRARRSARPASRSCTRSARRTNCREVQPPPGGPPYVAVPYVDRMDLAYAAADMVLCRAGAMTVAELSAVGLPAAYVPLPHRQRRAAAQRPAGGRRPAAGCWSTTRS